MLKLCAAILFLVASHVVPSQTAVRGWLVAALGRGPFLVAYSLVSTAALAAVIAAYRAADAGIWLWQPAFASRYAALAAMPVAVLLLVCRLTQDPERRAGIYRVTTTPGSLAVLLWSLVHLLNVGEARAVAVFTGMAAIAVASLLRHAALTGGLAGAVPFARILAGTERFVPAEIGIWRPLLAVAVTALLVHLHPFVIGADPVAGLP